MLHERFSWDAVTAVFEEESPRQTDTGRRAGTGTPRSDADGKRSVGSAGGSGADRRIVCDGGVRMPIEELDIEDELALKERAIDEAPVGITISDPDRPDNQMIYINDAFERLTGYDKEAVVRRNCRFLQGADTREEPVARMREAIDAGEPVSVELRNYRKDGTEFWNRVDVAPVHDEDGEVTHYVGFQTDVTDRKEAEMAAKQEREKLEHLLVRIEGLVQDVTRRLVQASSRAEVESAVCDRVAAVENCAFAWIVTPDLARETLTASASAGEWDPPAGVLDRELNGSAADPTVDAYRSGELRTVTADEELAQLLAGEAWLDADQLAGVAGVPLAYDDTVYGVLTVYTTEAATLPEHETVVLAALGRATGTTINALERGRLLASDNVTELDLRITDDGLFPVALSDGADCALEYGGSVYKEDGSVLLFFTTDREPGPVLEVAASLPAVDEAIPLQEYDDATLFEFRVTGASMVATLAKRGAHIDSMAVERGVAELSVEFPNRTDAREIVELLRERYPEIELAGRREREQPTDTKRGFVADIEERLTERQLTALQKAYLSGYFDRNRATTGTELAASMEIDRSTYHQHLRAAERKLLDAFFDR